MPPACWAAARLGRAPGSKWLQGGYLRMLGHGQLISMIERTGVRV
jgi:hypothetical protein